ncbi:starch-binding protein [Microbulbifer sp. SH-1]|uniref:PQQ-dependent sugar dehydrogenase n=1 Tax=Microbulbifer sp. SH-1 TaxID=2681547 RepID=UPI0014081AF2|nr:PQQ-dependent sugar dehydrogenase [Microbulbifer sp. SH-1]QIL90217.1 starch-binding protein [Microbulbifer sp. SH-1]
MISAPVMAGVLHSAAKLCLRLFAAWVLLLPVHASAQIWSEAWFRGTPNDWGATAMTYDSDTGAWVTEQTFDGANSRFKISHYQNWNEAYPANDYLVANGRYRIAFDDASKAITVTEIVEPPPESTSTSLCFDNPQNYAAPHIYFWNAQPAGSVSNLPGWPGLAMTAAGENFCYDFAAHLANGTMPDSLNVIFNDNGNSQTADQTYSGDPCYLAGQWQGAETCGLDQEPPVDQPPTKRPLLAQPLNFPISGNVSGGSYRFEVAYPNLQGQFMSPVMVIPDGISDLLYVVDKTGSIFVFPNREEVAPTEVRTLLDINGVVRNYHEQGLLSMAFDPDYASNGFIYIYYIHGTDDNVRAPDGSYGDAILERWTVDNPNNPTQVIAGSSTEILRVPQRGPDHKGGMMQFHPEDKYLYLSIGDGAYGHSATMSYPEDPRTNNGAQETDNLLGTFIRIKPLAQPVDGKYYEIPADNPFVGVPGFRGEIWSYGHRNPWRWSFDTEAPYTLWETEVGQAGFEEVNLIEKGKNYGWPICEGTNNRGDLGGDPGKNCSTDFEPPRDGYAHPTGFSIIGGVVYRGSTLPGLGGHFVFGDYVTKRIWSIVDGEAKALISDAFPENIASFGTDLSGDTLLVVTYGVEYGGQSTIYKVVDDEAQSAVIPAKLSETGLFADLENLQPVSGVLEYSLNTQGWFDGASTRHFIALPNDSQITFAETDHWDLPIGTVLVKHQSIATADNPAQPFTTSVLFRQDTGKWQAANYYWNSAGTDADLVTETLTVMDGGVESRQRAVQSAADCGSCHIGSGSREPLAVHTRQLNRDFQYGEGSETIANQLDVFNTIALFSQDIGGAASHDAFVDAADTGADLNERARTYLDTNCSHCHASSFMDLRYDTPLADMRLVNVETTGGAARLRPFDHADSLVYIYQTTDNNRMPKGTRYTNPVAEALFRSWIGNADAVQSGIALHADSDRLNSGDALAVQVHALYDNGFTVPVDGMPSVSSSDPAVLAVESVTEGAFVLRAGATGSASITVQQGGFSETLTVSVTSVDTSITRLEIAPTDIALNGSRQLVAFGVRADGTRKNLYGQVSWSVVSGPATVDQNGFVTRTGNGDVTVQVQLGEFTASATLAEGFDGIALRFDNPDSWAQVYVHLWITVNGQDQALTQWPGVLMAGPDEDGFWTHYVDEEDLPGGEVNLVFNSGNGQQTGDQRNIAESSSFVAGAWEPWTPEAPVGGDTSRVSVIGGSTADGERDYSIGSVITVNADVPPLGTAFGGWSGDAAPYIVGDPSLPQVQLLIPRHDLSLVALFPSISNAYEAGQNFYAAQCAGCHGDQGQGDVAPALAGTGTNWQLGDLTQYIEDFMPMDAAASCAGNESGACAYEIARLMVDEAWNTSACTGSDCDGSNLDGRNLRLLTREEYLNSVRDIFGIDFDLSLMGPVPADGRYRNFDTASFLTAGNDRTLGYELVAEQVADIVITQSGFGNLVSGCGDNHCVIDTLGFRLFRRPLTGDEVNRYAALYSAEDDGRLAIQAMLMSPHFMYRSELGELDAATGLYRLTHYEIATLLSYTFWVTTPDDALLLAASEASFDVAAQVDRLLADPRAERGLRRFIGGWLINNQYPFPAITSADLIAAFKEETVGFVLENIRGNSAFSELLSANYTWANGALAAHYGLESSNSNWSMRTFPAGDPRSGSGLLGHGSFLASRTSTVNPAPIKRGVYVREVLMCQEFPPPAAADFNVVFEDSDSNREATARHTSDPACSACHQFIDGVGFGFERFGSDALYRTIETIGTGEQREIDDSGSIKSLYTPATVMDPTSPSYDFYSVPELAALIAGSDQGEACFARQFYRYVVGREEGASDDLIIHHASEDLRNGGGMRDMLRTLVLSDAFVLRR